MHKTTKIGNPLWAKILFEAPEYVYELLYKGMFPKLRKNVIDLFLKILVFSEQQRTKPRVLKWVESTTLNVIEWINDNWKKTYTQNVFPLSSYISVYNIAEYAPLIGVKLTSGLDSLFNELGIDQIE
jgi:hypothetical protein